MRPAAAWLALSMLFCLAARGAVAAERPNVLIAISDDQSYPHASAYGSRLVRTPAFDRVACEGVLFTRAYVASPGCSPSRAALLTGRHTWQLEQAGTHASSFPSKYRVLPELLEGAGYHVGYTGKGWGPGNWKKSGRQRNPAGPSYAKRKQKPPHKGISANDYGANFADFLAAREGDRPFLFWYGASEPHRGYEAGAGRKVGKKLADAEVPPFLPDNETIRGDLLDYGVEIEWFDRHLARMLAQLDEAGELDNTIVIVTGDNGMPFPRAKANCYEFGIHVPLAIRWPARVPGNRTNDDLVSLIDLAPTILEAAGVSFPADAPPMSGRSLLALLTRGGSGVIEPDRVVLAARERHSCSRYENKTYPQRALRFDRYLYIRNFAPQRWPAGAPRKYGSSGKLGPPHAAYHDIDACPSLSLLVEGRDDPAIGRFFHLAVDKRPAEELFDVEADPGCLRNLADDPAHADARRRLAARLEKILRDTGDPRLGENGDVWERYPRLSGPMRKFPPPADERTGAAGRRRSADAR